MRLPSPVRRLLAARDARIREEGVREGVARMRARRSRERYRYVFVVTYGRSGSTLVQGVLNTLPRTLVRGENNLYVLDLFRAWARFRDYQAEHQAHGSLNDYSAFYGLRAIRRGSFMQAINDIVTAGVIGRFEAEELDVLGFKEVLWHRIEPDETEEFFDAMDRAFPGARYVLNTRDTEATLASGFWRKADEDEARRLIGRVLEVQEHLRRTRPDRVLDITYETLTGDDDAARDRQLRALGEFVTGRPVDDDLLGRLHDTLAKGHGPRSRVPKEGEQG